uniref:Uncharacterized protein n=1 Tax=Arundo donax TaxID=35708 RepID=A0A0A9A0V4_ARUDO
MTSAYSTWILLVSLSLISS